MNILYEAAVQEEDRNGPEVQSADASRCIPRSLNDTDSLRLWNACRFVKMGWFSAYEAIYFVDLFFTNMNPLSPILTDFFASHKNQFYLVTQEPMLCCTILMISSRHHTLPGVAGDSRTFFIHHRLWQHCQHLLMRLVLGQEKLSKGKTRIVGTVEALLLMSEWYPRQLQFPPDTDGWDSDFLMTNLDGRDPPIPEKDIPVSDRWREDVVEPTKRFERMSWMVLSSALALSHELGAFETHHLARPDDLVGEDAEKYMNHLELRRRRLPSLLFIFINALSCRIGCTSPMASDTGIPPLSLASLRPVENGRQWLFFINSWMELTKLTMSITDKLFFLMSTSLANSSTQTFLDILEEKQLLLADWHERNSSLIAPEVPFSDILFAEYQHLRILVNSVGMQLVVQRVLSQSGLQSETTIDRFFIERARQLNMTTQEYGFIEEVFDGCRQSLERVVSLGNKNILYFSPMRILFRTISSSIFMIKALALGARNSKLREALQILDQVIIALEDKNHDDVHLKFQYATLLKAQVKRLRDSLVSSQGVSSTNENYPLNANLERQTFEEQHPTDQSFGGENQESFGFQMSQMDQLNINEWLFLPFDASMAPFGPSEWDAGARLDGVDLDLDFLWQIPS
ncbi:hypothetical protein N7478_011923 [Penicillium angulare]|uniref:uncharacterized protein n=1 Tax=Penicillium angulare TaxID=116970 RepID=UPI00254205CC|nr:uncharacterized protein N7478_011923 [Penicillium angulare]KAJ5261328.1 hypothetical protein N7478_011923 [Penicillium angulare]